MAEAYPNLDGAREAINRLLGDRCVIRFDADGRRDDVLNEDTGIMEPPAGDAPTIWAGPCKVRVDNSDVVDEVGKRLDFSRYTVTLPWDAPVIPIGAEVEIIDSARDRQLVGMRASVRGVERKTFLVSRRLQVEEVRGADALNRS